MQGRRDAVDLPGKFQKRPSDMFLVLSLQARGAGATLRALILRANWATVAVCAAALCQVMALWYLSDSAQHHDFWIHCLQSTVYSHISELPVHTIMFASCFGKR